MFSDRAENKDNIQMLINVNWLLHINHIKPIHHIEHNEQLKGFDILTLPFNHLPNPSSILSIIPLISIIKHTITLINNKSNII